MRTLHRGPAGVAFDDDRARCTDQAVLSETMPGVFDLGVPSSWALPSDATRVTVTLPDGRRYAGTITYRRAGVVVFKDDA